MRRRAFAALLSYLLIFAKMIKPLKVQLNLIVSAPEAYAVSGRCNLSNAGEVSPQ